MTVAPSPPRRFISLWAAGVLFLIVWGVVPWALSLLSARHGWTGGWPGPWNVLGLIPLAVGAAGTLWGVTLHAGEAREGIDWEVEKDYLLMRGPYAWSRNPMYVSELILMAGWAVLYGSAAVAIALLVWFAFFNFYQIPSEERIIERHFGAAYLEYKQRVRRYFGKVSGSSAPRAPSRR